MPHFTDNPENRRAFQTIQNSMTNEWAKQNDLAYVFMLSETEGGAVFQSQLAAAPVMAQHDQNLNSATLTRLATTLLSLVQPDSSGEITIEPYGKITIERFPDDVGLVQNVDEGFQENKPD